MRTDRFTNTLRQESAKALWLSLFALFVASSAGAQNKLVGTHTLPEIPIKSFQNSILAGSVANDRKVLMGSLGSDLWRGPSDAPGEFWMISDRGPNGQIRVDGKTRRTFWIPEFNPAIVKVKLDGSEIRILETIPILGQSGQPVTGLPNIKDFDETPYDYSAQKELSFNTNGLDTEGLVRTRAGDFWVSEEYSPSLLHIDRTGKIIKRYVPEGLILSGTDYPVAATLPAIYAKRKINRGFEGLALSSDEKTLYLLLQSPLLNPDRTAGDSSRNTRLLAFDVQSEKVTAEYAYQFDVAKEFDPDPRTKPEDMKLSAVVYLNPTTLLVLERTDMVAKLYTVDLSKATNILKTKWNDPKNTPSLEMIADPASTNLTVLPKSLLLDLGQFKDIPEKIEGVALLDRNTLAIANDNDFDTEESKYDDQGNNVGKGKKSQIMIFSLGKPLPVN